MALLRILGGQFSGQTFGLTAGSNLVGRGPQSSARINDASVSGRHAQLWAERERWFVMDLGSTNGTYKNDGEIAPSQPSELRHGDRVNFGNVVTVFDANAVAPASVATGGVPMPSAIVGLPPPPARLPPPPNPAPLPPPARPPPPPASTMAPDDSALLRVEIEQLKQQLRQQQKQFDGAIPRAQVEEERRRQIDSSSELVKALGERVALAEAELEETRQQLERSSGSNELSSTLEARLKGLAADLEASQANAGALAQKLQGTLGRVAELEAAAEEPLLPASLPIDLERIEALEAELAASTSLLPPLHEQLALLEAHVADASSARESLAAEATIAAEKLATAQARAEALDEELAAVRARAERLEAQLADSQRGEASARKEAERIEVLDEALASAKARADRLEAQLSDSHGASEENAAAAETLRSRIAGLEGALERVQSEAMQTSGDAGAQLASLEKAIAASDTKVEALEIRLIDALAAAERGNAVRSELDEAREKVTSLAEKLDASDLRLIDALAAHDLAVSGAADFEAIRTELAERKDRLEAVEAQLLDAVSERDSHLAALDSDRQKLGESAAALEAHAAKIERLEAALVEARAAGDSADEAASALARARAEGEAIRTELSECTARLEAVEARLTEAVSEKNAHATALDSERERLREAATDLENRAAKIDRLEAALVEARSAGESAGEAASALARARAEVEEKAARVEALEAELTSVRAAAASAFADAQDSFAEKSRRVEALEGELAEARTAAGQVRDEMTLGSSRIESLEAELARVRPDLEALSETRAELAERHAKIAALEAALDEARSAGASAERGGEEARVAAETRVVDLELRLNEQETALAAARDSVTTATADLEALRAERDELARPVPAAPAGDDGMAELARAGATILREIAAGMLDAVNADVSQLRRNSEILRGHVEDCGKIADLLEQLDLTAMPPDQAALLQQLADEVQPRVVFSNIASIVDENSQTASRTKGLVLDFKDALQDGADGADLEQAFAKGRSLLAMLSRGAEPAVDVAQLLPVVSRATPADAVIFAYALLREARSLAADGTDAATIRLETEGFDVSLQIGPLNDQSGQRYRESRAGGGDAYSRFVEGFVRLTCGGDFEVAHADDGRRISALIRAN